MRKKTAIIIISYLSCAVLALGIMSWVHYTQLRKYEQFMTASYQRSFNELVTSMSEIDYALQKSVYATSPSMASSICAEVFGKAMTAQMSLGSLPFSTQELEQTASFISRVGDYSFALSRSISSGNTYSDEELNNLTKLSETASLLAQNLRELQLDMIDGRLQTNELRASQKRMDQVESQYLSDDLNNNLRLIEQEFPEVPALIYDGPFSEHITGIKPKMLEGKNEVTEDEARKIAADFMGISEGRLYYTATSDGNIPSYFFNSKISGGELTVAVTRQGGEVLSILSSRLPESGDMSAEDAVSIAERFIERRGFKNMTRSYYMIQNHTLTANFAYVKDDVVCYPDLVKVSVALDTGAVCGFESRGYLTAHYDREIPATKITVDEARKLVSSQLTILAEEKAIVPTDGKSEVICYEFKCQTEDDKHYIIYVNAVTGVQERILVLLEDESGTLTV